MRWAAFGGDRERLGAPIGAASVLALAVLTQALVSEGSRGRPGGQGPGPGRGKYRTVSQIPQFTLNFVDFNLEKHHSDSTTEIEIIAPNKVVEPTQNITERVTQVQAGRATREGLCQVP